jgi:hypothetical protein
LNDDECKKFIECLVNSFPKFEESAKCSLDIKKTHRAWAEAWRDLTFEECLTALEGLVVTGNITQTNYGEPGPFIRRLVMELRSQSKFTERQEANLEERQRRLNERRELQTEFRESKRSMAKAFEMLAKGVDESKALSQA